MSAPQLAWYRYQKSSASAAYQARKSGRIQGPMRKPKVSASEVALFTSKGKGAASKRLAAKKRALGIPSSMSIKGWLEKGPGRKRDRQANLYAYEATLAQLAGKPLPARPTSSRRKSSGSSTSRSRILPSRKGKTYAQWVASMNASQLAHYRAQKKAAQARYKAKK